jgi:hypothetical protein
MNGEYVRKLKGITVIRLKGQKPLFLDLSAIRVAVGKMLDGLFQE